MRSVPQPAFAVTASHPLIWCTRMGVTVRCLTVAESAALMGFPADWKLPLGSRAGLRTVGNAVPPPLARAVMACAAKAAASRHRVARATRAAHAAGDRAARAARA